MNLRQIEVFRATMLAGSTTDAARLLHVSQPGISRMISHIELQLGVQLFERGKGRLRPTPEAHALHAEIEQVYHGVKRIEARAQALRHGGGQTLKVLASPSLLLEVVPRTIATLAADYPEAKIYVESQLVRDMTRLLSTGEADVGISTLPVDHAPLLAKDIGGWTLSCVFLKGHHFEQQASVSLSEIWKEHLIAFSADTPQGRFLAQSSAQAARGTRPQIEVRSGQLACALVAAGGGIAIVDSLTARAWPGDQLSFRPIKRAPAYRVHAIRNPNFPGSAIEQEFVERIRKHLGTHSTARAATLTK
ncbi:LysR family transcriptional regulator [Hylemonella gracilis]|uniref:LysR family transcriptional regulator n=1 Tax=Hylemonella gracilis TaxID=80880 RepID=A0A4P6UI25_9BURK|nr:LysR substrate-binding domain-containing protein [Hylemonella gracilis]QBK04722.1 LysR family transcriptional regulator [Hylemonella gracilis]